jgi:hypothetical protein
MHQFICSCWFAVENYSVAMYLLACWSIQDRSKSESGPIWFAIRMGVVSITFRTNRSRIEESCMHKQCTMLCYMKTSTLSQMKHYNSIRYNDHHWKSWVKLGDCTWIAWNVSSVFKVSTVAARNSTLWSIATIPSIIMIWTGTWQSIMLSCKISRTNLRKRLMNCGAHPN